MTAGLAIVALLALAGVAEGPRRTAPERPLGEILVPDDYPAEALARGAQGRVAFVLEIDRAGAVAECRIETSSGHPDLDRATCAIMRERARFRPALDRRGRPLADRWTSSITWQISDHGWPADRPVRFVATFAADARGEISCGGESDGAPGGSPLAGGCDVPAMAALLAPLGREHGGARLTRLILTAPAGAALSGDNVRGELLYEWEGRLSVAPDGTVVECRATKRLGHGGNFVRVGAPDICVGYSGRVAFRLAPAGTDVRIVQARHALYRRLGAAE